MIHRIPHHSQGLNTLRLVQAIVMVKVTYRLYHSLDQNEEKQVNVLIRSAYKAALELRKCTSTEMSMALGLRNTYAELKESVLISQREQLNPHVQGSSRESGNSSLSPTLGRSVGLFEEVSTETKKMILVAPIPKNMHGSTSSQSQVAQETA